jgi:hypothetical protein
MKSADRNTTITIKAVPKKKLIKFNILYSFFQRRKNSGINPITQTRCDKNTSPVKAPIINHFIRLAPGREIKKIITEERTKAVIYPPLASIDHRAHAGIKINNRVIQKPFLPVPEIFEAAA